MVGNGPSSALHGNSCQLVCESVCESVCDWADERLYKTLWNAVKVLKEKNTCQDICSEHFPT